jgi:hypothetical protein
MRSNIQEGQGKCAAHTPILPWTQLPRGLWGQLGIYEGMVTKPVNGTQRPKQALTKNLADLHSFVGTGPISRME